MSQRNEDDWNARVWMVRAKDGRQAPEPVSLTKIRRGVELGKLVVDMEISRVDGEGWETISAVLSRYSPTPRADESALFSSLSPAMMATALAPPPPAAPVAAPAPATPAAPLPPLPTPPVRSLVHTLPSSPGPAPSSPGPTAPLAGPTAPLAGPTAPLAGPTSSLAGPTSLAGPPPVRADAPWINRIEKMARSVLWLSIASMCVLVSVAYVKHQRAELELREALRHAADQLAELKQKPPKPAQVLTLASMGATVSGLSKSEGHVWFTNASPRVGVVCLVGVATNPATQATAQSLPACHEVGAYASAVHVTFMFAGRELDDVCGKVACTFGAKDAAITAAGARD